MRSIPTSLLKGSEILGETLYTSRGKMLVKEGTTLTELLIGKFNSNKIFTVYIHDEHSDNQINRIIDQSLRLQGIEIIRELFTLASRDKDILEIHNKLSEYADDVLYETSTIRNQQIEYIVGTAGSHFPHDITEIFAKKINPYPEGSLIKLSDGREAVVDEVHDGFPLRPSVRIITKVSGKYIYSPLNLMENNSILIEEMIWRLANTNI